MFTKRKLRTEERGNAGEALSYWKMTVVVLKRRFKNFPRENEVQLRRQERKTVFALMDKGVFSTLGGRARRKNFQMSEDQVIWNEDSPYLPRSIT